MDNTYPVHVRVAKTNRSYNLRDIGKRIDDKFNGGTVRYLQYTRSNHLTIYIKKKEVADTAKDWIQSIDEEFSILDIESWAKGILHNVPKEIDMEDLRREIESNNHVNLLRNPRVMKEADRGNIIVVYFKERTDFEKCKANGVRIMNQKFSMSQYIKKKKAGVPQESCKG